MQGINAIIQADADAYVVDSYGETPIAPVTTAEVLNLASEYASAVTKWGSGNVRYTIYGPYASPPTILPDTDAACPSGYIHWGRSQIKITRVGVTSPYYIVDVYIPQLVPKPVSTTDILNASAKYKEAVAKFTTAKVQYEIYGPYATKPPLITANTTLYSGYDYYGRDSISFPRVTSTGTTPLTGMGSNLNYLVDVYTPGNILSGILPCALIATAVATVWVLFARK